MKVTLITVCFNSAATLSTAIDSVLSQKGVDIEYIIVDGGSTDGTVEIIKEYSTRSTRLTFKWISEKDRGMYDAINKGIKMATGDVVGILNADDVLASDETLKRIVAAFEPRNTLNTRNGEATRPSEASAESCVTVAQAKRDAGERFRRRAEEKVGEKNTPRLMPLAEAVETVVHRQVAAGSNPSTRISIADSTVSGKGMAKDISRGGARIDAVYADIRFVKEGDSVEALRNAKTVRYCSARRWRPWMFRFAAMVPHPSFYVRRECFERLGGYSLDYRICADFELELRYLYLAKLKAAYLPECVVVMRMGGMSTSGWRSNLVINREDLRALRAHGIWSCMPLIYLKYLFKIWGFVFRG